MIKLDPLDAHDRYSYFTNQSFSIAECVQDLINQKPFGSYPFYIFAHTRTEDDGITKRLIWQPRLTKPKSQTNSMLFKAYPGTDVIKVIWMIPARELWKQYGKGNITENQTVANSIHEFVHNRNILDMSEDDDLSDEKINQIYKELSMDAKREKMMKDLYSKKEK